jgi:signal transduction histidine kinase
MLVTDPNRKPVLPSDPIVAGSAPALAMPLRLRLACATFALLLMAALGLIRALSEPSSGWRFDLLAPDRIMATAVHGTAQLQDVRAIRGVDCRAQNLRIELDAELMRETGGIAERYAEHDRFYRAHEQIWTLIRCSQAAGQPIAIEHAQGVTTAALYPKPWRELGLRFWFPWAFGLLAFSVGLAVWVYRPVDRSASWYLLASASYAFWVMVVAAMGSRHLTQDSAMLEFLHLAAHAAGHLYLISLCMLLWRFPTPLDQPWLRERGLMSAMMAWASLFMLIDVMQWVPTINLGFRLPNLALSLLLAVLFAAQWRASAHDPLKRAPLRWLGFLLMATLSLAFVTSLFAIANKWTWGRMAYGFAPMSLIFVGFVPLVTRVKLFKLETWWTRAWLWFLGGVLVVLLDVLLIRWFALDSGVALGLALALAGWVYFPLRQWLWQRLSSSALPQTSEVLPDIVALCSPRAALSQQARWIALWENHWQPAFVRTATLAESLQIQDQGQALLIPAMGTLPALSLGMPLRGTRLYSPADQRRALEIYSLVRTSLLAASAAKEATLVERHRIAADLHDDLGAKLLTIAQTAQHSGQGPRLAELARQALEDMRLAVRGWSVGAVAATEAQADWRAEQLARLDAAGIEVSWSGNDPSNSLRLSATAQVQITRVLRETISNVVRHSQATRCDIALQWSADELEIDVRDNGRGLPASQVVPGHRQGLGLNNIERRINKLGGQVQWQATEQGGLSMHARMPLSAMIEPDNTVLGQHIS